MAQKTSQVRMQVAGEFREKQFFVQLWHFLEGRPYDIVSLKLEVPTVMGAKEKAPSFMQFDVILISLAPKIAISKISERHEQGDST